MTCIKNDLIYRPITKLHFRLYIPQHPVIEERMCTTGILLIFPVARVKGVRVRSARNYVIPPENPLRFWF